MFDFCQKIDEQLLETASSVYPILQLPKNKDDWDMGWKCLAFFDKELPLRTICLPTYWKLIRNRILLDLEPQIDIDLGLLGDAIDMGMAALAPIREQKKYHIDFAKLKKYRSANCGELSEVACQWLRAQGVNATMATVDFMGREKSATQCHQFVVYTVNPEMQDYSFRELMLNTDTSDVRILDVWTQQCGTMKEMLNTYCNLFLDDETSYYTKPMGPDISLIVEPFERDVQPEVREEFIVGHTEGLSKNGQRMVELYAYPMCRLKIVSQHSIDCGSIFSLRVAERGARNE